MDRKMIYPGQIPLETDLLDTNRFALIGLGKLAAAVLGTSTLVNGFACTPTAPASMQVQVAPGEIYSLQNLDGTSYSSLAADTTHQILKQGLLMDAATLNCPAPATSGYSINYLIEATYQDVDGNAVVLPYYNASNPSQAYSGPANSGTAQNTTRKGVCTVLVKAGVAAATGTQQTPAADSGYVGLWVVTVAYGQTQITAANIAQAANAPFLPSGGIVPSVQNNAFNYALDTGTANTYLASYNPPVTQLTDGMMLSFRAKTANTGASTFSPNGLAAKPIYSQAHVALLAGEIAVNGFVEVEWSSALNGWVLCENSGGIAHGATPAYGDNSQKLATTAFVAAAIKNKNPVINGGMDIAQRAASFALPTAWGYGSLDRWAGIQSGTSQGVLAQASSGLPNISSCAKLGRNSGARATGFLGMLQAFESSASVPLQGKTCTLSFWAKAGANYSGGASFGATVWSGQGVDQAAASYGSWTGGASAGATNPTLTTGWQRFSYVVSVPALTTQLALLFTYTPTGTAGADDNVYITGVQFEPGSSATDFDRRPIQQELALCQRYYEVGYGANSIGPGNVSPQTMSAPFKVTKRIAPTLSTFSPATGAAGMANGETTGDRAAVINTGVAGSLGGLNLQGCRLHLAVAPTGNEHFAFGWIANAEI